MSAIPPIRPGQLSPLINKGNGNLQEGPRDEKSDALFRQVVAVFKEPVPMNYTDPGMASVLRHFGQDVPPSPDDPRLDLLLTMPSLLGTQVVDLTAPFKNPGNPVLYNGIGQRLGFPLFP